MTRPVSLTSYRARLLVMLAISASASGCDWLGLESAQATAQRREAEGKAIGGACRHAGRALEDCFVLNKKADKAAVFSGWRDMNDYMRENQMEVVKPLLSGTGVAKPSTVPSDKPDGEAVPVTAPRGGKDS